MASVGPYREGIERMAQSISKRESTVGAPTVPLSSEVNTAKKDDSDYVVDLRGPVERAQALIDAGVFKGDDLEFLKDVVSGKTEL